MKKIYIFCFLLIVPSACKPSDPSVYDIKSPCASGKKVYVANYKSCAKKDLCVII